MTVIPIGRINDDHGDLQVLCGIWKQAMSTNDDIAFEFHYCDFLRPNALVFLGGLARLLQQRSRMVDFRWQTLQSDKVQTDLAQNGFLHQFGAHHGPWKGNSVPFREDVTRDAAAFENYLGESRIAGPDCVAGGRAVPECLRALEITHWYHGLRTVFQRTQ